ncbi:MAG: hypothetical protein IPL61_15295 [Myxococcales bacterium]|nr:hypothetical protein [Myxococcales bacterium]
MIRSAAAALAIAALGCGSSGGPPAGGAGATAATALAAAVDRASTTVAPWRCATLADPAAPAPTGPDLTIGRRTWRRRGQGLTSAGARLTVAAVADARGATAPRWREALREADVDVVLTLGGMGTTEAELSASLGALVDPAWLTVAIPGSAEAWPAHRAAVAALAAAGAAIVDGGAVRIIDGGGAVIATLPGEPSPARLAAATEGCVHDDADVAAIVAALRAGAADRPTVLASPRAPQLGLGPRTGDGVNAGDPALAAAVVELTAVIHAPLAPAPTASDRRGEGVATIAAGSLDPVPRFEADGRRWPTSVTAVTIEGRQLRWRAVTLDDR